MTYLNIKNEEKIVVKEYMNQVYNHIPKFIDTNIDIPDCYFEFENQYYAVEVTRYFQQNLEKEHIEYINYIEKYLKSDYFFEEVHNRLGKKKQENITIVFYNVEELNKMIINNIKFIKCISIGNNYFFNEQGIEINNALCCEIPKEKIDIKEFIEYAQNDILNQKDIHIIILTKNKYNIDITFKFCRYPYFGKNAHKKAIPVFCWFEHEDELYNNIIGAIEKKNNKLVNEYKDKLDKNKIIYNYYNLVLYSGGIGAELDEEKLYKKVIDIKNLQYDEIIIFLWKKIMVINKNGFKIFNK